MQYFVAYARKATPDRCSRRKLDGAGLCNCLFLFCWRQERKLHHLTRLTRGKWSFASLICLLFVGVSLRATWTVRTTQLLQVSAQCSSLKKSGPCRYEMTLVGRFLKKIKEGVFYTVPFSKEGLVCGKRRDRENKKMWPCRGP
jgi:hypothetical protein